MIENLETRTLFAATALLSAGNLLITGTPANDAIHVNQSVSFIKVTMNGVSKLFLKGAVKQITANLLAGDDRFTMDGSVYKNATVYAGLGNDYVSTGSGSDRIFGQDGNDTLLANDGWDYLHGGNGNDSLNGGYEDDILIGGAGRDKLEGWSGIDRIFAGGDGAVDQIGKDEYYTDIVVKDAFDVFVPGYGSI